MKKRHQMNIRFAEEEDSRALLSIYAQYINTPITFENVLPAEAEFAERIKSIKSIYPYLLCEEDGKAVGYAYAHRQKERAAYAWNVELSVYINREHVSRGIGKKLYAAMIENLKLQGVKTAYAGITLPNIKSVALHHSFGFRQLGVYRNTGYKCGKWHDVAWFEKTLSPYAEAPEPVKPVRQLDQEQLGKIMGAQ